MIEEICKIEDSLVLARNKFPGRRNSLDALINRFEISGYDRSYHGGLVDAKILADVYVHLTGGQGKFEFLSASSNAESGKKNEDESINLSEFPIPHIAVSKEDKSANDQRMNQIKKDNEIPPWSQL
jgi:DNA polymerase III epsilon subunit-like protein